MKHILIILSIILVSIPHTFASFSDTLSSPYRTDIDDLVAMGVIQGYDNNTFRPHQAITRAEILKIVMRSADLIINQNTKSCFSDVPTGAWYTDYVCYAKLMEIIQGYGDGTFRPDNSVLIWEAIKIALWVFGIQTREERSQEEWRQRYIDMVKDLNIFTTEQAQANQAMTREMMAHLVINLLPQWSRPSLNEPIQTTTNKRPLPKTKNTNSTSHNTSSSTINTTWVLMSQWCKIPSTTSIPTRIIVNDSERTILTKIGRNYNPNIPAKLVIAFHWRTNSHEEVSKYYKVDEAGDGNTIFVYPLALPESGPSRSWTSKDYIFFDSIIDTISENYCIDHNQISVIGHSLGASFANDIACVRGDIISNVASIWGSVTVSSKNCTNPINALVIHNPNDNLASFNGGIIARDRYIAQNQCDPEQYRSITSPQDSSCIEYTACTGWSLLRCESYEDHQNGRYYPHRRPSFAPNFIRTFITL